MKFNNVKKQVDIDTEDKLDSDLPNNILNKNINDNNYNQNIPKDINNKEKNENKYSKKRNKD